LKAPLFTALFLLLASCGIGNPDRPLFQMNMPQTGLFGGGGGGGTAGARERPSASPSVNRGRPAPELVSVARGDVVIGGPPGYCVDRSESRLRLGTPVFVLMASCAKLNGQGAESGARAPGILTASIDRRPKQPTDLAEVQQFLSTGNGLATLSRDGVSNTVSLEQSEILSDALIMKITDNSETTAPLLDRTYWRGLFTQNGRLVTVTANAFEARPLDDAFWRRKVLALISRIRAESPNNPPPEERTGLRRAGGDFLQRLLP
jgi:hypothetical protein